MATIPLSPKIDIPLVTVLSALLFFSAFCFKSGESVYFGYPSYYITLDLVSVINLSLKMTFFICGTIGLLHLVFDDGWRIKKAAFWFVIATVAVGEITNIYRRVRAGNWDIVDYMDGGPLLLAGLGMFYFSINSFYKLNGTIKVIPAGVILALCFVAAFSFLCGVNYHRQLGATIWKTNDGKYLIADYKDGVLLKQCINGKGVFTIKDYKGLDFVEVDIRKDAGKDFRCE